MERNNNMKKITKAILMAALGLALVPSVKASSGYDLIAGFTTGSGSDNLLDIGPVVGYPGATALYDGEQWNLTTDFGAGFTSVYANGASWGVIGDADSANDGASPQTLWVTTSGPTPPGLPSNGSFGQADSGISAIEDNVFGNNAQGNYESSQGQTATVAFNNQNSWNAQTMSGTLDNQFVNAYGNPNVSGDTADTLWQIATGGAPVDLGSFTLSTDTQNGDAILTFNVVPEPSTWALFSACGLLALVWRHRIQRKQA